MATLTIREHCGVDDHGRGESEGPPVASGKNASRLVTPVDCKRFDVFACFVKSSCPTN
ncbi:hypothetical protein KIN20_000880 [Parelaphostrongylus tenuis]|uniref:Uncharacterized protein n=1 Tax=Parelaphostrongylus tenuis TaxID=148309 RepID=A0AAD5LW54_PARTN|nr:hypothetical protein KIN20_000880 [Parelaphostrongylus tenuis]